MGNVIEKFLRTLMETPRADDDLVREGAYPVRGSDGTWSVPVDRFERVLHSYFQRTFLATGGNELNFDGYPTYGFTTESFYARALAGLADAEGIYLGLGAIQSFIYPPWMRSVAHIFSIDYNASLILGTTPLWGALLCMFPWRASLIGVLTGNPVAAPQAAELSTLHGAGLVNAVEDLPYDRKYSAAIEKILRDVMEGLTGRREAGEAVSNFFTRIRYDRGEIFKLYDEDGNGRGGPLSSEVAYRRQRALFMDGLVTGVAADIATDEMDFLFGALEAMRIPLGAVYLSNVEAWFPHKVFDEEGISRVSFLYNNLMRMAGFGYPVAISSLHIGMPAVYGLESYLSRAMPFGLPPQVAVPYWAEFVDLRYGVTTKKNAPHMYGDTPSNLLMAIADSFDGWMRELVVRSSEVVSGGAREWGAFDLEMRAASEVYAGLPDEVKNMFLLNMVDLGAVRPPYPLRTADFGGELLLRRDENIRFENRAGEIRMRSGGSSNGTVPGPIGFRPAMPDISQSGGITMSSAVQAAGAWSISGRLARPAVF